MVNKFTHIDNQGQVRMVDITGKKTTDRLAVARGVVSMNPATLKMITDRSLKKGNVLETARIAGIMAAKKTSNIIPMCHPVNISHLSVDFSIDLSSGSIIIKASARTRGQTGVEMEAMIAVSVAALTVYDMCKSQDKMMSISDIYLLEKSGGKSGTFTRKKHA